MYLKKILHSAPQLGYTNYVSRESDKSRQFNFTASQIFDRDSAIYTEFGRKVSSAVYRWNQLQKDTVLPNDHPIKFSGERRREEEVIFTQQCKDLGRTEDEHFWKVTANKLKIIEDTRVRQVSNRYPLITAAGLDLEDTTYVDPFS